MLRDVQQRMADVATVAEENIVGVHVVKSFAQEQAEQDKFERRSEALFAQSVRANRQRAFYVPVLSFLPLLGQAAVLLVGGEMVVARARSRSSDFVALQPLPRDGDLPAADARDVDRRGPARDRVRRADLPGHRRAGGDPRPRRTPASCRPGPGRVRFEGVTFGYDAGAARCSSGIDLELEPGKTVALIGHTGSGKTTLASLIPRFYDVQQGRVTIDGADVRDVTLTSLRREIGVIAQDPFLFSATVRENLAFGRPGGDRRGDRERGAARAGARVHRAAAGRLRHGDRRARDHALGRPAPAARDRARARRRPADPDPRRRDRVGRRRRPRRGSGSGCARRCAAGRR